MYTIFFAIALFLYGIPIVSIILSILAISTANNLERRVTKLEERLKRYEQEGKH